MASKPDDPASTQAAADELLAESKSQNAEVESDHEGEDDQPEEAAEAGGSTGPQAKKKKSKKKRMKAALGMGGADGTSDSAANQAGPKKADIEKAVAGLSKAQIQGLLEMNPSLAEELRAHSGGRDLTGAEMAEQMKRMKVRSWAWIVHIRLRA